MEIALFGIYVLISLAIGRAMQKAWGNPAETVFARVHNVLMISICWPIVLLLAAYDQVAQVPEEDWSLN